MELKDVAPKFAAYLESNGIRPSLVERTTEECASEFKYASEITKGGKYFHVNRTDSGEKIGTLLIVRQNDKQDKLARVEFKGKLLPFYENPLWPTGNVDLVYTEEGKRGDYHSRVPFP